MSRNDCNNCRACLKDKAVKILGGKVEVPAVVRMIVCPTCGNKRCQKASDHELACTGSNEPGQQGSVYA